MVKISDNPWESLSVHKFDSSLGALFLQEVDSQAPGSELGTQAPWKPCKSAIRPWGCPSNDAMKDGMGSPTPGSC